MIRALDDIQRAIRNGVVFTADDPDGNSRYLYLWHVPASVDPDQPQGCMGFDSIAEAAADAVAELKL